MPEAGAQTLAARAEGLWGADAVRLADDRDTVGGLQPLIVPVGGVTPSQRVRRNGCDRIANGLYDASAPAVYPTVDPRASTFGVVTTGNIPTRCFPENYLVANPQINNATFNANLGRNNFHSLQVQMSMRPVHGFSFQSTYTWAKSMTLPASAYNDPLNRELDRQQGNERKHDFRMNGTLELPIGPNKLLFGNTSGWVARMIERWQTSVILNLSSGSPQSVTGGNGVQTRYASASNFQPYGNAHLNPTQYWTIPKGHVEFGGISGIGSNGGFAGGELGTFFGVDAPGNIGTYTDRIDPQCTDPTQVAQIDNKGFGFAADAQGCNYRALALRVPAGTPGSFLLNPANPAESSAVYVLVQPKPGEVGKLASNVLTSFGNLSLDGNAQKSFTLTESKQLTIRIDATNVLNHPQPFIPLFSTVDTIITQFGIIECGCGDHKSGTRTFQGQVRLTF